MPGIHYFDTCDSLESAAAGSVLQLIARVYDQSAASASNLLTRLVGEPVEIGMEIVPRPAGKDLAADGSIIQRGFKILVVTRVDSAVSLDQILRHASSFGNEDRKVLLLVTRDSSGHQGGVMEGMIRGNHPDVIFRNITFGAISDALGELFGGRRGTMADLIDGYREFCDQMGLFERSRLLLRIVPCGRTIDIFKRFGIYFQPVERAYHPRSLIGMYSGGKVHAVLDVRSVFDVEVTGDRLTKRLVEGVETDEFDAGLLRVVEAAKASCGCDVATGTRFFCGDVFETDFRKSSAGDIVRMRLVDLDGLVGGCADAREVALRLNGREWA